MLSHKIDCNEDYNEVMHANEYSAENKKKHSINDIQIYISRARG